MKREIYLKNSPGNKGNGYYHRQFSEGSFCLDLTVPRDRHGEFRPYILPQPYQRVGASYTDVLYSLIINGYSPAQLHRTLSELRLPYTNLFLQRERLLQGRWKNPVPILKANTYELRQIFNRKFYAQT